MVYNWADDVAPIFPAGTILHVINWHDNTAKKTNPEPVNWVGNGNRTIDEMSFSWVNYYTITNVEYDRLLAARRGPAGALDRDQRHRRTSGRSRSRLAGADQRADLPAAPSACRDVGDGDRLPRPGAGDVRARRVHARQER